MTGKPSYWLVMNYESGAMEMLTLGLPGGKEVLPLFSFEEEARTFLEEARKFLKLKALGSSWRIRGTSGGELVSVLCSLYARCERVALDPLAEISAEMTVDLVGMGREEFVQCLLLETVLAEEHGEVGGK